MNLGAITTLDVWGNVTKLGYQIGNAEPVLLENFEDAIVVPGVEPGQTVTLVLELAGYTAWLTTGTAGVTASGLELTIADKVAIDVTATLVLEAAATYPSYIAEADKVKYDAWVAKYNVTDRADTASANQKAYLLNVDPTDAAAVKTAEEEFKITSITVNADGSVTVTMPEGKSYNGTVEIRGCETVNGEYTAAKVADKTARFFKAILQ